MKKFLFLLLCFGISISLVEAKISPTRLRCEYLENPQPIDVLNPRLSWVNIADAGERGQIQTAWEVRVAGTKGKLLSGKADLWASGKIISDKSNYINYKGKPLQSRQDCWWQVRTWDKTGKVSEWSQPAFWSMGLLNPEEWKAQWIGAPWQGEDALPKPVRQKPGVAAAPQESPPPALYCGNHLRSKRRLLRPVLM